jgi:predicted  nucleic acid-binding Zn-ribbon protein
MSAHEPFEELCALAVTGDLEPDEFRRLGEHLYECASCRAAYRDFHAILERGFPALDSRQSSAWSLSRIGMKKRFFAKAAKEGLHVARQSASSDGRLLRILAPATLAILVVVSLAGYGWYLHGVNESREAAAANEIALLSSKVAELQERLGRQREPIPANAPTVVIDSSRDSDLRKQLSALGKDYQEAIAYRSLLEERISLLSSELEGIQNNSQAAKDDAERLQRNLREAEATLARTRGDIESLRNARTTDLATITQQRTRIEELSTAIREQTATITRDRDLLAADKDIRDLMGARNLRVVDVEDEGTPGKVRPLAGRVFYTKDKSLVFYAYDLQSKGNVSRVDFQVWGKREGRSQPPRSLGILYADASTQNRWVLKFEETDVLAQIDQVFVTVEPRGGSKQPTGKPLLAAAFLNEGPNHP